YNITGLDNDYEASTSNDILRPRTDGDQIPLQEEEDNIDDKDNDDEDRHADLLRKKKKKGPKKYKFTVPNPPSKSAPPGPAYSPQTLSLLGYTQYFANLTYINNDFIKDDGENAQGADGENAADHNDDNDGNGGAEAQKWKEGKHQGRRPRKQTPHPRPFRYEVEYTTYNDSVYALRDLSVRSYLDLARRIGDSAKGKGKGKGGKRSAIWEAVDATVDDEVGGDAGDGGSWNEQYDDDDDYDDDENDDNDRHHDDHEDEDVDAEVEEQRITKKKPKHGKKHDKKKHRKHRKAMTKLWYTFVKRAYVSAMDKEDLEEQFGELSPPPAAAVPSVSSAPSVPSAPSVSAVASLEEEGLGEQIHGGAVRGTRGGGDAVVERWEEL
ncbi:hypothetical protein LTS18_006784, partial [Coniosporium uncinatum]